MKANTVVILVALLGVVALIMGCANLDFGDIAKVDTPIEIQKEKGYPKRMSVNDAQELYEADLEDQKRNMANWKGNIEDGQVFAGMLSQLSLQALNDAGPMIAGVPVLGPAMPLVTGLGAWFLQGARTGREKRASFNKGLQVGAETASKGNATPTAS